MAGMPGDGRTVVQPRTSDLEGRSGDWREKPKGRDWAGRREQHRWRRRMQGDLHE